MSRIGRKPVALPSGVTVEVRTSEVRIKGPKGELSVVLVPAITVAVDGSTVTVTGKDESDSGRARHGLIRVLIENSAIGVSKGYEKKLEIIGVGYKAQVKGKSLVLNLGHSHPITLAIPEGIEIAQDEKNKNIVMIRGISKELVGQFAADIRSLRPPEPYKGKGVRYFGENVRRKPGKAAVSKAAA
ncbi:MAG: 50S ribosomal protein L6 [Candidatus Peregrinibacteria bacterium]|nr:50S ribosomal protein L6 [Candidatus Peregrinibacteria bacterium]